ncbi:uncharacterized protein LOC143036031 [Oratosquilla oratoria]|uniref:uncharacterized protein LOC143036031 n=1 Tax=Oratosquilla oratoria TaxID=337810 RepID=UPI003F768EF4
MHKPSIPLRPMTSEICSAPHRLAKQLAKPLKKVRIIKRNPSEEFRRYDKWIKDIQFTDKKLHSLDMISLFTNIPVNGTLDAIKRVTENLDDNELPIPKPDYLQVISLSIDFDPFAFNQEEYKQHYGLPMGSPFSAVDTNIYLETLEMDNIARIIGRHTTWLKYVEDITPKTPNMQNKVRLLSNVHEKIKFTLEEE